MQNDLNLASPPQPADCTDSTTGSSFSSHFKNEPFGIDDFIPPTAKTCPAPGVFAAHGVLAPGGLEGGCTRTSCTATTRSSTSSTAASRTATSPAATRSA